MNRNNITYFLVLIVFSAFLLSAQCASDVKQAEDIGDIDDIKDAEELLSIIAVKQYEKIYELSNVDWDDDLESRRKDELRKLYLRYFRTEESLRFDKNTFGGGELSDLVNYISSDDGAIRVFSWAEYFFRTYEYDSIVQYRDSKGRLRTVNIPQMAREIKDSNQMGFNVGSSFYKIYKLKEGVYLLEGVSVLGRYMDINFVAIELKKDAVVPYLAFNNSIGVSFGLPALDVGFPDLNYLPEILDMQIISKNDLFAIELDIRFPRNPINMYKTVDDHTVEEKETFKHRERFVFNGTEFLGNYWVLPINWLNGERPADIPQFFKK